MRALRAAVAVWCLGAACWAVTLEDLAALFADGRLDEVISAAGDQLAQGDDVTARYWLGRAWIARAEELRAASTFGFASDLADSSLERAIAALDGLDASADGLTDAREWHAWARFLKLGTDVEFGAELEAWFAETGRAYAAELRGRQLVELGDAAAADWYGRAVAAGSADPGVALEWAVQLAAAGRREEAVAAWQTTTDADPFARLATLLSVLPGVEGAERRLRLVRDVIENADLESSALAAWHEAFALRELGRADDAEVAFARVADAEDAPLGFERSHAALLVSLGRHAEAVERLAEAVSWGDVAARDALRGVADELAILRRHDEALAVYERVLEAEPNDGRALRNRALTLSYAGRIEAAEAAWDALLTRSSDNPDLLNDAALCAAGWGDRDRALVLWEAAVPLYGSSDARENLAHALVERNPQRAAELADSVLADEPDRNRALFLRYQSRLAAATNAPSR